MDVLCFEQVLELSGSRLFQLYPSSLRGGRNSLWPILLLSHALVQKTHHV